MNEEVMYDRASVRANDKLFLISTLSGYYGSWLDPRGVQHVLLPNASPDQLGDALLDALEHSRVGTPEDAPDLYLTKEELQKLDDELIAPMLVRFAYKSRRAMFRRTKNSSVYRRREGVLSLCPSIQKGAEWWVDAPDDQNVVIPASSSATAIGDALQLALDRCR